MKEKNNLLNSDGELYYVPDFIPTLEADQAFNSLKSSVKWENKTISIFGKQVPEPRQTAWYGNEDAAYSYSGIRMVPLRWTSDLLLLKEKVESYCGTEFNSVLLNYYRNGSDSMGWHRDNERELGTRPLIASLSLGAERRFLVRRYKTKDEKIEIIPRHGSLIIMAGDMQTHWEHCLPKQLKIKEGRINLTFRLVKIS